MHRITMSFLASSTSKVDISNHIFSGVSNVVVNQGDTIDLYFDSTHEELLDSLDACKKTMLDLLDNGEFISLGIDPKFKKN